jgi:hypothetical protein
MEFKGKHVLLGGALLGVGALVAYSAAKPRPTVLAAKLRGFEEKTKSSGTTTRRSTGETARDFLFYPLLQITPDVNGTFRVEWSYSNTFDGSPEFSSGPITNEFTGLVGGTPTTVKLIHTGPTADPAREGAIAIGDVDFIALGKQDGQWHSFMSDLTIRVVSPSGASVSLTGRLGPEDFKSVGVLTATLVGFDLVKKT